MTYTSSQASAVVSVFGVNPGCLSPACSLLDSTGKGQAAGGAEPGFLSVNSPANPAAKRGSIIVLYGTGDGVVTSRRLENRPICAAYAADFQFPVPVQPIVFFNGVQGTNCFLRR